MASGKKKVIVIGISAGLSVSMKAGGAHQFYKEDGAGNGQHEGTLMRRALENRKFAQGIFILVLLMWIQLYGYGKRGKDPISG